MADNKTLTHQDQSGKLKMVDVARKQSTLRTAIAFGSLYVGKEVLELLLNNNLPKGDAWAASRVAGIIAAKKTSEFIPLTHPIRLDSVEVNLFPIDKERIGVFTKAVAFDRTGVEMEAMIAASAALMNMYDMVKGISKAARVETIQLIFKEGGKSGDWIGKDARTGRIKQLTTKKEKGAPKKSCDKLCLKCDSGIENTSHDDNWREKVSLLDIESIEKIKEKDLDFDFGSLAKNIVTSGFCLCELRIGSLIYSDNGVVMKVSQIGKESRNECSVCSSTGNEIMLEKEVFVVVLSAGTMEIGDRFVTLSF